MRLRALHLSNVRNYAELELEPAPGLNLFVGRNAQGKSNLLEAIALLGTGKSFRTSREHDLIREGCETAAVSAHAQLLAGEIRLGCTVAAGARGTRKNYAINGQGVRYARFLGSVRVVTFVPADLQLIVGPPSQRRAFLNAALSQERKTYYHDLARYQQALAQKAALLRSTDPLDPDLLAIYDHTLVEAGTRIMLAREEFTRMLAASAKRVHAQWVSSGNDLTIGYAPSVACDSPEHGAIADAFTTQLRRSAGLERVRRATLVGPHRDELVLLLGGRSLAAYGSQGEQRTAVLALKVAEYSVMQERSGEAPLLLLDDVLSELDSQRARAFLDGVGSFEQAFITATHLPPGLGAGRRYVVEQAEVRAL